MKIIEVITESGHIDTVKGIAAQQSVEDSWICKSGQDDRQVIRLLVASDNTQTLLDALQTTLGGSENSRIIVIPVEVALPKPDEKTKQDREKSRSSSLTREELYNSIEKNARLDSNFLVLVALSTLVVTIGLLEDNIAVVIGAMVIAPLLGPNIALALATALGDTLLIWKSIKTNLAGLFLTLTLSVVIGYLWPFGIASRELLVRTEVGLDSIVLALASGGAAVLSLTTGLPSVLVGVMVAVALLPPAVAMGLSIGAGHNTLAIGAGLLLAVNIVCINLSAKIAFHIRGVKPRTWLEQKKAKQSMITYISIWALSLVFLVIAILVWGNFLVSRNP